MQKLLLVYYNGFPVIETNHDRFSESNQNPCSDYEQLNRIL